MAITDSLGDFLTQVRNAYAAKKDSVTVTGSKLKVHVTELLKQEGYISDFSVVEEGTHRFIHMKLRYLKNNKPAILDLQRVSKPGLRVYVQANKVPKVLNGLGTMVVSTSRGVMTDTQARENKVGGELICKVW